jgi:hypothetical protein
LKPDIQFPIRLENELPAQDVSQSRRGIHRDPSKDITLTVSERVFEQSCGGSISNYGSHSQSASKNHSSEA